MESPSDLAALAGLFLLGFLSFCLALAETALMALPRERVKEWKTQGKPVADTLDRLIDRRKQLLGFFEFFQMFLAALYFSFLALVARQHVAAYPSMVPAVLFCIFGFGFYLLLCQFFPRRLALQHVEKVAKVVSLPIAIGFRLFGWVDTIMDGFSTILANLFGHEPLFNKQPLSDEEIKMLVSLGKDEQLEIEEEEKEMLESVMTFGETLVKEIMTPRIDMVCVKSDTPISGMLDTAISHGYSKFPVYEETIDNITGIVYIKDLFKFFRNGQSSTPLKDVLRKPFFVPESKKVADLLRDMQKEKISMAIIVDEYGGTDGLVTVEDIVEEIVGELDDEHDTEIPDVLPLSDSSWLVDGQINIEDLNEKLKLNLPTEEFETLAGYLYGLMGKVPKPGDRVETEGEMLEVTVVHRQRISKVKITLKAAKEEEKAKEELS